MNKTNSSAASLKAQAKRLRTHLAEQGAELTHSQALEAVAKSHGFKDWNTAAAEAEEGPDDPYFREKSEQMWQELHEARSAARALRSEAGWDATWPFPWEKTRQLTVNGRFTTLVGFNVEDRLSYEDVLLLVYPEIDTTRVFSVTWKSREGSGSLTPGESVQVTGGTVFNVVDTGNA